MRLRLTHLAALALLLMPLAYLHAQEAPTPDASPVSSAPPATENVTAGETVLKVQTNLVSLYFTAYGKNNEPIDDLKKDDCTLYEDRVAQTTKNFEQVKDLPLTLGILLDTSGSQTHVLPLEQQTGSAFLKRILTPKDEAFLISFDVNVDLLADYTNNAGELESAMNKAQINAGFGGSGIPGMGQGPMNNNNPRGTLLYDAVYLAAHDKMHQEAGRKVLVLLTDGGDQGSQENINGALEAAQKSNVLIYVILIADHPFGSFGEGGAAEMRKLTEDTGGRLIDVGNNGRKLEDAFAQIEDELRTQYLASYTPLDPSHDGSFRLINLKCNGVSKIQTRKGYYAVAAGSDQ
jgi:VWFA-related protein